MRGVYENNTDSLSHTKEKCFFSFFLWGAIGGGVKGMGHVTFFYEGVSD